MKRILSILLMLCLLGGVACAEGTDAAPLRVLDGWSAADNYRAAYPDRAIESIEVTWDGGHSNERDILLSGDWDAMCVNTYNYDLAELDQLGLVLDMNSVAATSAVGARLYPSIYAGCSAGDKLVALPAGFMRTWEYCYRLIGTDYRGDEDAEGMALREQLGFTAEDQPTTFAEVCALGLRYMALDRATRKGTIFLFSDTAPQGFSLLYGMITTYQTEATAADGTLNFDTADFRKALADADPLLAAFAADPKRTYGKDKSLNLVLNEDIGPMAYGSIMRTTEGTSIPANMTVVIVNPGSKHLDEAIDFALVASTAGESSDQLLFYKDADYDALLDASYDAIIAGQIAENEDESVIADLEARKLAKDDAYFTSKAMLQHYVEEMLPNLVFRRWYSISMDDAIQSYLAGKLDADGFIAALNAAAAAAK